MKNKGEVKLDWRVQKKGQKNKGLFSSCYNYNKLSSRLCASEVQKKLLQGTPTSLFEFFCEFAANAARPILATETR
jgi:hypothetical protein